MPHGRQNLHITACGACVTPEYLVKLGLLKKAPDPSRDIGRLMTVRLEPAVRAQARDPFVQRMDAMGAGSDRKGTPLSPPFHGDGPWRAHMSKDRPARCPGHTAVDGTTG